MVIRENLLLYFLDTLGLDLVHQSAEDDSILENLCEVSRGKLFIKYSLDPLGNRAIESTVLCCLCYNCYTLYTVGEYEWIPAKSPSPAPGSWVPLLSENGDIMLLGSGH